MRAEFALIEAGFAKQPDLTGNGSKLVAINAGATAQEALTGAEVRTLIGLAVGTDVQAYDSDLTAISVLTSAADRLPYATGVGTWAMTAFTTAGRALIDDADAAAQRSTLGLVIGVNVQAWDADLDAVAAAGAIQVATQAEMETGTSTVLAVSPGRQHFHPSSAKFWAYFGVAGDVSASYNVTSVTDNGTGDATVNIATDFSSNTWAPFALAGGAGGTMITTTSAKTAGTLRLINLNSSFALIDPTNGWWSAGGFGDLA